MRFPAVRLFVERAAASGGSLELTDLDAPVVGDICNSLGGVALAIELAASRVNAHGLHETAALLGSRFGLHWRGRRTAVPRHQTLNAMLDWSYRLLEEPERTTLRKLSIFVGVFSLDAAEAVASDHGETDTQVADALASLVEKSLISMTVVETRTTYRLLETTRAYALAKLAEAGEVDVVSARHASYFTRFLVHLAGPDTTVRVSSTVAVSEHLGNVRAALAWSFSDRGQTSIGTTLAALAAPLFLDLSLLGECLEWSERALSELADADRGTSVEMDLQETLAISSMFTKGNGDDVRAAILRGLALAETLGDSEHRLRMLAGLNIFLTRIGDFRGALAVAEQSETTARSVADPAGIIMADWMLGVAQHLVGNQTAAQNHCEAGLKQAAASPNASIRFFGYDHRIRALVALTRALWLRGFPDQALAIAQQAIDEAAEHDQPVSTCISLIYTAPVFIWCGDFRKAADLADRLVAHAKRYSLTPYHAVGLGLQGELLIRGDDAEAGLELLHLALDILNAEKHNIQTTTFLTAIAEGQAALEHYDAALATIDEALAWGEHHQGSYDMPEMMRIKGSILASMGRSSLAEAEACFSQSLDIARRQATLSWELRTSSSMADLLTRQGRTEDSIRLLGEVYTRFSEGFETRDLQNARP
ncbi:ATP-binding protein [Mesorhizobium sp. A623]